MTGDQLSEWEAFDRLEPIGGYKQDFRFAQLCDLIHVVANALGGGNRVRSKIQDFMPWWFTQYLKNIGKIGGRQSVEEIKKGLLEFARQHNKALENKARKSGQEK